jgi:hypothetical protein
MKCRAALRWALLVGGLPLLVGASVGPSVWRVIASGARVHDLVARSKGKEPLYARWRPGPWRLRREDIPHADRYIRSHPDFSSYLLLLALLEEWPEPYERIPKETRAAILCSALSRATLSNGWGWLSPEDGGYDYPPARALLDTGDVAVKYLTPLLDDRAVMVANGSKEATLSFEYRYRRCDFAYRYLCLLRGLKPSFAPTPEERDKEIDRLKAVLGAKDRGR